MATQYQQVLTALKALGGEGTMKEIWNKILEGNPQGWKTKTPMASLSMYLTTNKDVFKNENKKWMLLDTKDTDEQDGVSVSTTNSKNVANLRDQRGLYFITLSPVIQHRSAGFLFKIGESDNITKRLKGYSASLPVETIDTINIYPIPDGIDTKDAEKQVNGELLGNDHLGEDLFGHRIKITACTDHHQKEWLRTLDIDQDSQSLTRFARLIDSIVDDTINALKQPVD